MPRYGQKRKFQIGDYWLSRQSRSPAWCRTWYCKATNQTRRVSLRTESFEIGKQRLTDWFVLEHQKKNQPINDVSIASIFARYFEKSAKQLKSADGIRRNLSLWLEYFQDATLEDVADLSGQEGFRDWLAKEKSLSASTIRKIIGMGKTAFSWSYKRREIAEVPYLELPKVPIPKPKGRHLEISEVVQLLKTTDQDHLKLYILMLIGTAARPQAVLDLTYDQIDFENDLIDLNGDRAITNKRRPIIKLPNRLKPILLARRTQQSCANIIAYHDQPVKKIRSSWTKARKKAGLDDQVLAYSFRRTMARYLTLQGIPHPIIAQQLGHDSGYKITEIYTGHSPDYLREAVAAIDHFFDAVTCEYRVNCLNDTLDK